MDALGIWAVRSAAEPLGQTLARELGGQFFAPRDGTQSTNRERFVREFRTCRRWVLIMASGIAVRYLQGLPADKRTDPAVVVLDEGARFAVPLLCGHEGRANDLA
ncbi:MAG: cobalamin biosynthesis protein CbiG, partial [Verrucomicrobia bacterium]|nr:cobalamin biosynthesis protein CbiG [Verrucomicrobiota bacterium]